MHCSSVQWPSLFFSASSIWVLIPQQCKDINLLFAPIFLIEGLPSFDSQFLDAFSSEVSFLDTVNGFTFCFLSQWTTLHLFIVQLRLLILRLIIEKCLLMSEIF